MSKASLCIQMLEILQSGRIYKVSELASLLETNPRNIIEYRKQLDEAGYYIDTIPGKAGGYRLLKTGSFPASPLTAEEKKSLNEAMAYILAKKDFPYKDPFTKAMGKIFAELEHAGKPSSMMVVDRYQLAMGEEDIRERYAFIEDAIAAKHAIEIVYSSIKNGNATHVLHPYKLFLYNNAWFFLAYNPEAGDVWTFKLNRIASYRMLDQRFAIWKGFDPTKYFDKAGLTHNGEYEHLEFLVSGTHVMLLKERVYGSNQTMEMLEDGRAKVSVDMQNKDIIKSFVLGCGEEIEVLSPSWVKEAIVAYAKAMLARYPEA